MLCMGHGHNQVYVYESGGVFQDKKNRPKTSRTRIPRVPFSEVGMNFTSPWKNCYPHASA